MFSFVPKAFNYFGQCFLPLSFRDSNTQITERSAAQGIIVPLQTGDTHYLLREPDPIQFPADKRRELVVLLHGASVYSFIWDRFVESFSSRGHPTLVFDFYGHGYSHPKLEASQFSVDFFCQQMEQLLEHLNIIGSYGSFILIGHSMGGLVASHFTSRHKDMVSKLILVNSAGIEIPKSLSNFIPSSLRVLQDCIRKTALFDQSVHFLAGILSIHGAHSKMTHEQLSELAFALDEEQEKSKDVVQSRFMYQFAADRIKQLVPSEATRFIKSLSFLYFAWIHQLSISNRSQVLLDILRGCFLLDGDYSKIFSSIDAPTLIIWGESDALLPKFMASDIRNFMPQAEILYLNGDHAAFLQKPMQTFQAIVDFVEFNTLQSPQPV